MKAFTHRNGHTLEVAGAALYYEAIGRDDAPPVVLLHGGLGTLADFNALLPFFAQSFRVLAIDSRGHGRSTLGAEALSYARLEVDVLLVTRQLGIDRFSVVGFSDGGVVGLRLAARARTNLIKLAVLGTPHRLGPNDPLRARLASVTPASWRAKFPETAERYERVNPAPDFDALVRASVPMWIDTSQAGYPADAVRGITCPTLVARGDDDPLVSRALTYDLVEQLPRARFLNVPFAGHELHKDQPAVVGPVLERFLRDQ